MRKSLVLALSIAVMLFTANACADDGDREVATMSTARSASVLITVRYEFDDNFMEHGGSGVIVAPDLVLTCFHVAWGNPPGIFTVLRRDGKPFKGELIAYQRKYDLALLKVEGIGGPTLPIAEKSPPVGTVLTIIGCPNGIPHVMTQGILSKGNVSLFKGFADVNMADITIMPGSSGSGVFAPDGSLVGLALGITGMKHVPFGFAILARAENISRFLDKRPKEDKIPQDPIPNIFKGLFPEAFPDVLGEPQAITLPFAPVVGKKE
jgi:S1-C subfamily serine protease